MAICRREDRLVAEKIKEQDTWIVCLSGVTAFVLLCLVV